MLIIDYQNIVKSNIFVFNILIFRNIAKRQCFFCSYIMVKISPAQIRTGVKGSKGLYAWPLHSAELIFLYRASGRIFVYYTIFRMLRTLCYKCEHFINWIIHPMKDILCSVLLSTNIMSV